MLKIPDEVALRVQRGDRIDPSAFAQIIRQSFPAIWALCEQLTDQYERDYSLGPDDRSMVQDSSSVKRGSVLVLRGQAFETAKSDGTVSVTANSVIFKGQNSLPKDKPRQLVLDDEAELDDELLLAMATTCLKVALNKHFGCYLYLVEGPTLAAVHHETYRGMESPAKARTNWLYSTTGAYNTPTSLARQLQTRYPEAWEYFQELRYKMYAPGSGPTPEILPQRFLTDDKDFLLRDLKRSVLEILAFSPHRHALEHALRIEAQFRLPHTVAIRSLISGHKLMREFISAEAQIAALAAKTATC